MPYKRGGTERCVELQCDDEYRRRQEGQTVHKY